MTITPFARQLMVAGSPQLAAFAVGGAVTYPSVLLQQFRANDSSIHLDFDTASWIGSIHGLTGIPSILMPAIMQWKGRKFAFMAACLISIIGWVLAYTATNTTAILISESFHGLGTHCLLGVSSLSISEMISPKLRSISMVSVYLVQSSGMATVGIIASFVHWRTISLIMCSAMTLAFLIACTWPESPSWLAYKGKFDKCEKAFVWLRGTDESSIRELQELISAQKEHISSTRNEKPTLRRYISVVTRRDFYLPSLYMILLLNLMYWSGSLVVLIYSSDIIMKATGNKAMSALGGIIVNTILFFGNTTTSILVRFFRNKTVLLCSASGTAISLTVACIVTLLQSTGVLPKDSMLCFYCLILYIVTNSLGVTAITLSMGAELMPVKHRGLGGGLYVIVTCILHASSLKLAPYLFIYLDLWGTFLLYAINAVVSSLLIWKNVPETKGKTLQQIEDYYNNLCYVRRDMKGVDEEADELK